MARSKFGKSWMKQNESVGDTFGEFQQKFNGVINPQTSKILGGEVAPANVGAVNSSVQSASNSAKFTSAKGGRGGKGLAIGFGVGAGIDTIMNMREGDDFGTAAVKGVFTGMLWTTMPGIMTAGLAAEMVPAAVSGYSNWMKQKESWWNKQFLPNFGGNYQDTQRALTMRQAGVQGIQSSKFNGRSALGGEAKLIAQNTHRY
jgi:hypothetical protein